MQLRHLRYFVKIVEAGSFSRAAATIHVAQPALSQQIAELEEELGISLLHRSARGVRPTAAGEILHREAMSILRHIEKLPEIVRSVGDEAEGIVTLGMPSTFASFVAARFMEKCRSTLPGVNLRLISSESMILKSHIDARTLDLSILYEDQPMTGLVRMPLLRQRLFLIRGQPFPGNAPSISLAELAGRPLVLSIYPNVSRVLLDRVFGEAAIVPNIVGEADWQNILPAVKSGFGDTILPIGDFSSVPGYDSLCASMIEPPIFLTASIVSLVDAPLTRAGEAVRDLLSTFLLEDIRSTMPPGMEWID